MSTLPRAMEHRAFEPSLAALKGWRDETWRRP